MSDLPPYQTMDGHVTNKDDPERAMWYSANCLFWTDDWTKLKLHNGVIPCCPCCTSVGYFAPMSKWIAGTERYEKEKKTPRYAEFVSLSKEQCHCKHKCNSEETFESLYRKWIKTNPIKES